MQSKGFSSLEKALDILASFSVAQREMSAQQISSLLGLPLSTTYRYLDILTQRHFLAKNGGSKKYALGLMLFRLGSIAAAGLRISELALPHMEKLCEESGETVLLTIISGWEAVCLERVEANKMIKLSMERGATLPLHAGASSKILLAFAGEAFLESYLSRAKLARLTENTTTDKDFLRNDLTNIRRQGYAFSHAEADAGARAVSAPVFDHEGKLAGGLAVAGPAERMSMDKIPALSELVTKTASAISVELGFSEKTKLSLG